MINLKNYEIIQASILSEKGMCLWHTNISNKKGLSVAGGFHACKDTSYQIAYSELCERLRVRELSNICPESWKLDLYAGSSGFAFGFDDRATFLRALCEATERWAWSEWIDKRNMPLNRNEYTSVSMVDNVLFSNFERVSTYECPIDVNFKGTEFKLWFYVVLGETDKGIFPGSRVSFEKGVGHEHASIEAWRHYKIYESGKKIENDHFYSRIFYFGENKIDALKQLDHSSETSPICNISFSKCEKIYDGYLWRVLNTDYISWDYGDEKRFVY
ncbi:hypothetical protein OAT67_09655 [Bacteriovoracaceae bacterium]|nr:hypothetical protein [Bacteriovoracaceae bacterium]